MQSNLSVVVNITKIRKTFFNVSLHFSVFFFSEFAAVRVASSNCKHEKCRLCVCVSV